MTRLILTVVALLIACAAAQQTLTMDTLVDDWEVLTDNHEANATFDVAEAISTGVRGYGSMRTITATIISNFFDRNILCNSLGGTFTMRMNPGVTGSCDIAYTAPMRQPFNPAINLNAPIIGASCWAVQVISSTGASVAITANTPSGSIVSTLPSFSGESEIHCIPIPNPGALSSVTGLQITTAGPSSTTIGIQAICPTPPVICEHTVTIDGSPVPDQVPTGTILSVSVTCLNFASVPSDDETVSMNFDIPQNIGTVLPDTRDCSLEAVFNPTNGLSVSNVPVADGASFTCGFDFMATGGGSTSLFAAVTNSADGVVSYSGNAPRGLCDVAQVFNLVVTGDVIPVTPTTAAPTTAPVGFTPPPVGFTQPPMDTPTAAPVGFTQPPPTAAPVGFTQPPTDTPTNAPVGFTQPPTNAPVGFTQPPTNAPFGFTQPPTNAPFGFTQPPTNAPFGVTPPTNAPVAPPTAPPTNAPFGVITPTNAPFPPPTVPPTNAPFGTVAPTNAPFPPPTNPPTNAPFATAAPTNAPVPQSPTNAPFPPPTNPPTNAPFATAAPTNAPVPQSPTNAPFPPPTQPPTNAPVQTAAPTNAPVPQSPTNAPFPPPTQPPTNAPVQTAAPTNSPTNAPVQTTAPTTALCDPFTTAGGVIPTGQFSLIDIIGLPLAPPEYCMRFDGFTGSTVPVTLSCLSNMILYINAAERTMRLSGELFGAEDLGTTRQNPEFAAIHIIFSDIVIISTPTGFEINTSTISDGLVLFRNTPFIIGSLAGSLAGRIVGTPNGYTFFGRFGRPFGNDAYDYDFIARVGNCIP